MTLEEALTHLRAGKKITNAAFDFEEDVYFKLCILKVAGEDLGEGIVKMKGEYLHSDMLPGSIDNITIPGTMIINPSILEEPPCKHGRFPQIMLYLLINNDWKIVE